MHARVKKLCVLAWEDRWSISIFNTFKKLVENVEMVRVENKSVQEVASEIEKINPDLCFAKNFRIAQLSGEQVNDDLELIFEKWKFPTAMWYLDNPFYQDSDQLKARWKNPPYPRHMLFFHNDPSFKDFFELKNLTAHHLPIGVDEKIFSYRCASEETKWKADLRFTGHPLTECALPKIDIANLTEGHISLFLTEWETKIKGIEISPQDSAHLQDLTEALQNFFLKYYTKPEQFSDALSSFYRRLQMSFSPLLFSILQGMEQRIGEIYSWWQLTCYLYLLLPQGMRVQGSTDWQGYFPDQQETFRELTWEELFASYRATKISFCFTKWSLPYAVHDRIYEVFAAGGFPLTDYRSELENHFESDEIAVYHSIEEARDLIDFYLKNESERLKIIEKGRARTLKEHTYNQRLHRLLDYSADYFGIGQSLARPV